MTRSLIVILVGKHQNSKRNVGSLRGASFNLDLNPQQKWSGKDILSFGYQGVFHFRGTQFNHSLIINFLHQSFIGIRTTARVDEDDLPNIGALGVWLPKSAFFKLIIGIKIYLFGILTGDMCIPEQLFLRQFALFAAALWYEDTEVETSHSL